MMRLAFIALLIVSQPLLAQQNATLRDAARGNVLGLTYWCVEVMLNRVIAAQVFPGAGFTYRAADRGVNEYGINRGTGHYFDAPAKTAHARVDDPNRPSGFCSVYTAHLNQAEVEATVAETLRQYFQTAQQRSAASWSVRSANGLPLLIDISTIGNNHRYEAPGTVQVTMVYPG
ncbi:MAG: hypothetical protein AAGF55_05865 [Pseudomonadota bacterium]